MEPFETALVNRRGGRESNQDCVGFQVHHTNGCWVVADGLGGHRGGENASGVVVESVLRAFEGSPSSDPVVVISALETAQHEIEARQQADSRLSSMGSTAAVLLASASGVVWGHVGDSRLYRFQQGRLNFHTRDHSVTQALRDAGRIHTEQVRSDRNRNRLTRSLGKSDHQPAVLPAPQAVTAGDAFLLCSDGFWEHVHELEMEIDLAKSVNPQQWLLLMEERLRQRAVGDFDNYTALGVFCHAALGVPGAAIPPDQQGYGRRSSRPARPEPEVLGRGWQDLNPRPWLWMSGVAALFLLSLGGLFLYSMLSKVIQPPSPAEVAVQSTAQHESSEPSSVPATDESETGDIASAEESTGAETPEVAEVDESAPVAAKLTPASRQPKPARPIDEKPSRGVEASDEAGVVGDGDGQGDGRGAESEDALDQDPEHEMDGGSTEVSDQDAIEPAGPPDSEQIVAEVSGPEKTKPEGLQAGEYRMNPRDALGYVWIVREDNQSGFWIGQQAVPLNAFVSESAAETGRADDSDLTGSAAVDWGDAVTYCMKKGGRLPTVRDWNEVVRGLKPPAGAYSLSYSSEIVREWSLDAGGGKKRTVLRAIWDRDEETIKFDGFSKKKEGKTCSFRCVFDHWPGPRLGGAG